MTEEQATRVGALIESEFPGVYAHAVDPAAWFGLNLDRWTTELVRDALISHQKVDGDASNLLEDVEDWLNNQAEPYSEDADVSETYKPINP